MANGRCSATERDFVSIMRIDCCIGSGHACVEQPRHLGIIDALKEIDGSTAFAFGVFVVRRIRIARFRCANSQQIAAHRQRHSKCFGSVLRGSAPRLWGCQAICVRPRRADVVAVAGEEVHDSGMSREARRLRGIFSRRADRNHARCDCHAHSKPCR